MKKDDYLTTMIQVPPKQRNTIHQFDLRTQREAFSVSLEGLKGVRIAFLPSLLFPPTSAPRHIQLVAALYIVT